MRRIAAVALVAALVGGCAQGLVRPDYYALKLGADDAYHAGDYAAAQAHYRVLVEAVPREADPWFKLGNIHARLGQPEAAVAAYQEALLRDPQLGKAWNNLAVIHLRQAVNAYLQLCRHTEPGAPLCARARTMISGVNGLLEPDAEPRPPPEPQRQSAGRTPATNAREQGPS